MLREGRGPAQADDFLLHAGGRRHGGLLTVHRRRGEERPGVGPGVPADQPSAGLPGVRPGRGVPAPGPGPGVRSGGVALRRSEAHVSEAIAALAAGCPGPRAVRAVRPVHQVLRPDLGRPLHRAVRPGGGRAGVDRAGRRLPVSVLREHDPDLPGRGAHRPHLPVRGPAVRPEERRLDLPALRVRMQPAGGPSPRRGGTAPGEGQRRGERRVAVRQGTLRVLLPGPAEPPDDAAAARTRPGAGVVRGSALSDRRAVPGPEGRVPGRRAPHGRGRLRAVEAGPNRLRDERCRSPAGWRQSGCPSGRGGHGWGVVGHVPRRRTGQGHPRGGPGRRERAPHPAPADPQGRPPRGEGVRRSPSPDPSVGRGRAHPVPPRRRGECGGPGALHAGRGRLAGRGPGGASAPPVPRRRGGLAHPRGRIGREILAAVPPGQRPGRAAGRAAPGAPSRRPARRRWR